MDKSLSLSADERILLALYLVNQEKSISWLAGWLGPDYDGKNVYSTVSRLAKRQLVIREGSDPSLPAEALALPKPSAKRRSAKAGVHAGRSDPSGIGKYRITQLGIAWLERRFPLVIKEGSDPSLKAVIIDAAEIKGRRRKLIFDELKRWRYGRMSRGVYLTGSAPAQAAVAEFVNRYRLSGYVNLMTIQPAEDPKILADRVFRLTDRNAAWRLLIDRMFEWKNRSESLSLASAKVRPYSQPQTGLRRIRQDFLQLLITEPGLPSELKPENYSMNSAIKHTVSTQS